jgi:bifunctional DNase/RNase
MAIEMKVSGLMVDPLTNMPIVILKSDEGDRILPIWVGPFEAQAIAMKRENVSTPRPMTHDLLDSLLRSLRAAVEKVVINDLRDNTFYALIHLRTPGGPLAVDSRPSDAIALALRADAPIFVEPAVLDKSAAVDALKKPEESAQRLEKWFETVDTDDFSKYQM